MAPNIGAALQSRQSAVPTWRGGTLIAWILPAIAEPPSALAAVGGAVGLGGVALALADGPADGSRATPPPLPG